MDNSLKKRLYSLLWRASMMGLAAVIAYIGNNLDILQLSSAYTVIIGLILGEISKYINNNIQG